MDPAIRDDRRPTKDDPGPSDLGTATGGTVIPMRAQGVGAPGSGTSANDAPGLEKVLTDTIRRWSEPTTPEELQRRGVRRIRSVSMNRVAGLLEKAVNHALIERTIDGDVAGARSLSAGARREFMRLTAEETGGAARDLKEDLRLHSRATSTLDRLRQELEERRRALGDEERLLSDGEADERLDRDVADKLAELFATFAGGDDRELEHEVQTLVVGELSTARRRVRRAQVEQHRNEIGVLERRVAKLSMLLGETEDALRKARNGAVVDTGVASVYDGVQGVDRTDAHYGAKTELMRAIFEANLELRQ